MYGSTLSCVIFGLPHPTSGWYVQVARRWSGQEKLVSSNEGWIKWKSLTKVYAEGGDWYHAVAPMEVETQNAIIRVGKKEDTDLFAFVAPSDSTTSLFRSAVSEYSRQRKSAPDLDIVADCSLNLKKLTAELCHKTGGLRSVSGITAEHKRVTLGRECLLAAEGEQSPSIADLQEVNAVGMEIAGRRMELDTECKITLRDVSMNVDDVADCLPKVVAAVERFMSIRTGEVSAYAKIG